MSCYAGMKYLGKDLPALEWVESDTAHLISNRRPYFFTSRLSKTTCGRLYTECRKAFIYNTGDWQSQPLGSGWSWDDFSEYYMVERSAFPVYGNVIRWYQSASRKENPQYAGDTVDVFISSEPEVDWPVTFAAPDPKGQFKVSRNRNDNRLTITEGKEKSAQREVPFVTEGLNTALALLKDTLHREIIPLILYPHCINYPIVNERLSIPSQLIPC